MRRAIVAVLFFACGARTVLTDDLTVVDAGPDVRDTGVDVRLDREAEADTGFIDAPCTQHTGVVVISYDGQYSFFDPTTIGTTKVFDLTQSCLHYDRAYSMTTNPVVPGAFYIATDTAELNELGNSGQCFPAQVAPPTVPTLVFVYGLGTVKSDVFAAVFSHSDGSHGLWKLQTASFKKFAPFDTDLGPCKLTGTATELWALCETWGETSVAKIDPVTGATLENHKLGAISGADRRQAMADAKDGTFWLFSASTAAGPSVVYSFDPKTDKLIPKGTVQGAITAAVASTACF